MYHLPRIDYSAEKEKCVDFLTKFSRKSTAQGDNPQSFPYQEQIQNVLHRKQKLIQIFMDDLNQYFKDEPQLVAHIQQNTLRYIQIFSWAVDHIIHQTNSHQTLLNEIAEQNQDEVNVVDMLWYHRNVNSTEEAVGFPDALKRRYEIVILPRRSEPELKLRQIKSQFIGHLVTLRGIVTRVTEVKPLITVATYTCAQCGHEIFQEITSKTFMPLFQCPSEACKQAPKPGNLVMQTRGSKLIKYQEIKIQELSEQVPIGHIPRSMDIHAQGELTRLCSPGDIIKVSGVKNWRLSTDLTKNN